MLLRVTAVLEMITDEENHEIHPWDLTKNADDVKMGDMDFFCLLSPNEACRGLTN